MGCVITYPDEFHILNKDHFVCRALDNRMGGFMIAQVARLLHENKKHYHLGCMLQTLFKKKLDFEELR